MPKLRQSFLILLNLKFASKHSMIAQTSCQHAIAVYPRKTFKMALNLNLRVSAWAHARLSYIHTCASHMEDITGKFLHIYGSCFMLQIDPRG